MIAYALQVAAGIIFGLNLETIDEQMEVTLKEREILMAKRERLVAELRVLREQVRILSEEPESADVADERLRRHAEVRTE
jgi:hypothetical protein